MSRERTYRLTIVLHEQDDIDANGPMVLDMLYDAQKRIERHLAGRYHESSVSETVA